MTLTSRKDLNEIYYTAQLMHCKFLVWYNILKNTVVSVCSVSNYTSISLECAMQTIYHAIILFLKYQQR